MNATDNRILVSIDDTDNLESRGTGYRARQLAARLEGYDLASVRGVTRHQLFVHPSIPYTSHNSALCLDLIWKRDTLSTLKDFVRAFLSVESAPGSDAGFCIAPFEKVTEDVVEFGRRAKSNVLTQEDAVSLAAASGLHLEGVTGDRGGIIGAIASVGLRKGGHDGRFVWVKGVRDIGGVKTVGELLSTTGIEIIRPQISIEIKHSDRVLVEPWPRPVLLDDKAVLLVEQVEETHGNCDWKILPREVIRQY